MLVRDSRTSPQTCRKMLEVLEPARDLHVTRGRITAAAISEPTVRAVARGSSGDAAELAFSLRGPSERSRALASGETVHQLGLKLRAQDSCNVIYVTWCGDRVVVSIKHNPGKRRHRDCGAAGYTELAGATARVLAAGVTARIRASIADEQLTAWIDDVLVVHCALPAFARDLAGPAGLRTDNLACDQLELRVRY